jgi:hypothetical protein
VARIENALEFTDAWAMAVRSAGTFRGGSHGLIKMDFSGRIIHGSKQTSLYLSQARMVDPWKISVAATSQMPLGSSRG